MGIWEDYCKAHSATTAEEKLDLMVRCVNKYCTYGDDLENKLQYELGPNNTLNVSTTRICVSEIAGLSLILYNTTANRLQLRITLGNIVIVERTFDKSDCQDCEYVIEDIGSGVADNGDVYLSFAVCADVEGPMESREFAYKITECIYVEEICFKDWSTSEETAYLAFDKDKQGFVNYHG